MTLKEVLDGVAEELYEFVGYKVSDNKGKAYGILYSAMDDIERSVVIRQSENNKERSFSGIMKDMVYDICNSLSYEVDDILTHEVEDILTYYTPLLEQAVAVDKYINESADNIMEDYPEDGSIQDKVDFFIGLKEKKKLIESKLAAITNVQQQIMPELIAWIDANPTNNLIGSNGKKASVRTSYYPKVTNLQQLKDALAEQWERFEGVNTVELGKLVRELRDRAARTNTDLRELMPPGVDVSVNKTLTVSQPGSKTRHDTGDGMNELVNLIMGKEISE